MAERLKAYVVLGCNGANTPSGFISCSSVENPIIDLTKIEETQYPGVMQFLDDACSIFDSPVSDYNKCVNTLSYLYKNFGVYDQKMLFSVQHFLKMHKECGVWLMLILKEDFDNEQRE